MAKTIRDLLVRVGVKSDSSQLTGLNRQLGITKGLARNAALAMTAFGGATIGATIHFGKAGAEAEKSQVAFETMTGSVEKANEIMKQMEEFSLETPFSFPEVEKNVKLLKAMGIEELIEDAEEKVEVCKKRDKRWIWSKLKYLYSQICR